jgi:hypothetical protein
MVLRGQLWTLAQLNSKLDTAVDDASDLRWTAAQKNTAIQNAVLSARHSWLEERIDDSNTYAEDTFRYTMPPSCYRVISMYFSGDSDEPRYEINPSTWHIEGNEIVFTYSYDDYDGDTLYIIYSVLPNNLLTVSSTAGVIASTTTKVLTAAGSTFVTNMVLVGDPVIINESGYAGNGTYYVASADSETQLTLHKAPGTAGASLDFTVAYYTDLPLDYLMHEAQCELYQMAMNNAPGTEIDSNIKMSTYYKQLAERDLERSARRPNPSRSY